MKNTPEDSPDSIFAKFVLVGTPIEDDSIQSDDVPKKNKKKNSFFAENLREIFEDDPEWDENLSGKAVYRRNFGDPPYTTIEQDGIEIPVDLSSEGDPRHLIYMYIPFGSDYDFLPGLGTAGFGRKFSEPIEIFPLEEVISFKDIKNLPVCVHLIPSKNVRDGELNLYDYPFTLMPTNHSCSSPELGHSPKSVDLCPHATKGTFEECSSYKAFEPVELGTLDGTTIVLSRTFVGYEHVHEYNCGEMSFSSFSELSQWAKDNDQKIEITWSPLAAPVPFFETVIGRLEVTYPRATV